MTGNPILSIEQMRKGLEGLSVADRQRLLKAAKNLSINSGLTAEDLLGEAILSALEGKRSCPAKVPLIIFLYNAMRSLTSNENEKLKNNPLAQSTSIDQNEDENQSPMVVSANSPSIETIISSKEEAEIIVQEIEVMFADDPQGYAVIIGDIEGWSPDEVCELEGISRKEYEAARKRRCRKLQTYLERRH